MMESQGKSISKRGYNNIDFKGQEHVNITVVPAARHVNIDLKNQRTGPVNAHLINLD